MCARPRPRRRIATDASGALAVEFAMIAPLLIIVLIGTFQVGWALFCASSVRYALDEAARALSIDPEITEDELERVMRKRLDTVSDAQIRLSVNADTASPGLHITNLQATYVHFMTAPLLPVFELRFEWTSAVVRPSV